jgi:K(+)-stimulated pyrophosphate-energized sodium pump
MIFAKEGGWQVFELKGGEWALLYGSAAVAVLAILVGFALTRSVTRADTGTDKMREIAAAIEEGAMAYLRRQFKTIAVIVVPVAAVVFLTSGAIPKVDSEGAPLGEALSFIESGTIRTTAFVLGCMASALAGFIGMAFAVKGNVRTAAAARSGKLPAAMQIAFRTGGVAGMFTVGLGLLGATVIIMLFQNTSSAVLIGFGFGGSLLALFLRVGGGIFTKAADVGADLVGKIEKGIPEDDARNPATIADNVGDNVGDCAGMASDLFESYEVTLVASIILGVAAFQAIYPNDPKYWAIGLVFPLAARAVGVLASIVGIFMVRAKETDTNPLKPIGRGFITAGLLTVAGTLALMLAYVPNDGASVSGPGWRMFGAVVVGLVLAQVVSRLTEYYTGTHFKPVKEVAASTRTGPATTVLTGTSLGLESSVWAIVAIAGALGVGIVLGDGNLAFTFYLVALTGMGMLATTGVVVAEDTFGPVADNAAGIAEMAGEFDGDTQKVLVALDAAGNTTKAVTKGFAIGSAVIASVALFASFIEIAVKEIVPASRLADLEREYGSIFESTWAQINVADPKVFIGLLIGGAVPFLFSSLAIRAVSRSAGTVVEEVRRQFREKPGIMDYTEKPDYGPVIDICTRSALRELITPALLAVLTPVIIGFSLGYAALGAFLAAVILVGQLMANYLSNAGGAWDNAKKYIEDGHEGGKGSEAHKAAVIGDTVGDPYKDTAGPALNPLIKVMNLVSLLILPVVIAVDSSITGIDDLAIHEGNNPLRYGVAAAALVVLLGAIFWSKSQGSEIGTDASLEDAEPTTSAH